MKLADVLLSFADLSVATFEIFDAKNYYARDIEDYRNWRVRNHIQPRSFYELKRKGLIKSNDESFFVTDAGLKRINSYLFENIKIQKPKKWDGLWRVIIFDIPEHLRPRRDRFRRKLKELGFVDIQKSVFCYPHECINELNLLARACEVEEYITVLEVTNVITPKNIFKIFTENKMI
jgi:phenylacetic acid degradation operon negative regulatory protein